MTLETLTVDDDMIGGSIGDGDGRLDYSETIELTARVRNIGFVDAQAVTGQLASASPFVELIDAAADFGDIPSGGEATNLVPWRFRVAPGVPDGEKLDFVISLSEDPGAFGFDFAAYAPAYSIGVLALDDGGGDGVADPGETIGLQLAIANIGHCDSPLLEARLTSPTDYYNPDPTPIVLGEIPCGIEMVVDDFMVSISTECPPHHADYLLLELRGANDYTVSLPFVFCTGQAFADDFEMASASWLHRAGAEDWLDQWHRDSLRNHTLGGAMSWKCGDSGSGAYGNLLFAALETEEFPLTPSSRLEFWQWMDAETSAAYAGYCYDGGLLEISTDGGTSWSSLMPEGGYPFLIRSGSIPGPFAAETPVWSGYRGWLQVGVDLSAYEGPVRLRWVFGSDGADVREGWYIDDVRVGTGWPSGAGEGSMSIAMRLLPVQPNPATPASSDMTIRFVLPRRTKVQMDLFDLAGRLVRRLAREEFPPGTSAIVWDGRDVQGALAPAGSYFLRMRTADGTLAKKFITIR